MNRHRHALAAAPLSLAVALTLASGQVTADMQTETVEYTVNGKTFTGYMAYDDEAEGKRPGVLVVHGYQHIDGFHANANRVVFVAGRLSRRHRRRQATQEETERPVLEHVHHYSKSSKIAARSGGSGASNRSRSPDSG